MKRLLLPGLLLALALGLIACGAPAAEPSLSFPGATAAAQPTSAPAALPPSAAEGGANDAVGRQGRPSTGSSVPSAQDIERMIVYTGSLSLRVNDTAETIDRIDAMLKSVNGYIASKSLVEFGEDKLRGTITIRVPATALNSTLDQIKALAVRVLREDAQSADVTEEYVDLDARRKNLEAYEVELQKLLETVRESTGKAEDILAVYNQLTQVRGEIEQIKGRQRYLENTSALATYTVELVPVEVPVVQGEPEWNPALTAQRALDGLIASLQGLTDAAIILFIRVLPVLIILLLPVVVFVWVLRALLRRRAPKKPVPA
jgi:hypothetical protein